MKKILLLIIVNYITTTYCQSFDGNLDSKSLFWAMEQKDFESLPRVGIPPMSIKLWDNYNSTVAPSQYGSLLEINGRVGHLVSQLYFSGNWDNGRVQYRSSFYGQPNWQDWRYLLDSKNDIETSGNLKINGNGNSYILNGNLGIGIQNPVSKLTLLGSLTINSGLTNVSTRPIISSGTLLNGEIRGYNAVYPLADDGFLRLSAGGATNNIKSYIDISGYSTQPDMNANIVMGTWGTERMRIDSNGNIGIGTTNPSFYQHGGNNKVVEIFNPNTTSNSQSHIILSSGSTLSSSSLGSLSWTMPNTTSPNKGLAYLGVISESNSTPEKPSSSMVFATRNATQNNWNACMILNNLGNLGIGTQNPDERLTVKGKIHAEEVRIDLKVPAPDYVFANNYRLKSLQEVEEFIKQNSHLPEIPSAKEIEKNGLMLAEMNMSLLKKIEELTLYTIEQDKKNNIQSREIEILKKENEAFKSLSERLSKIENQLK